MTSYWFRSAYDFKNYPSSRNYDSGQSIIIYDDLNYQNANHISLSISKTCPTGANTAFWHVLRENGNICMVFSYLKWILCAPPNIWIKTTERGVFFFVFHIWPSAGDFFLEFRVSFLNADRITACGNFPEVGVAINDGLRTFYFFLIYGNFSKEIVNMAGFSLPLPV